MMAELSQIITVAESKPQSPSVQLDERPDIGGKPGEEVIEQTLERPPKLTFNRGDVGCVR
jgi:hypothetical protein